MNKKILIFLIPAISIVLISSYLLTPNLEDSNSKKLSFSYNEANKELQSLLALHDLPMSSALKLNGFSIEKYCTFFTDEQIQKSIEYCTSTELLDLDGNFLGNIQMVGKQDRPQFVIGVIQTDSVVSQLDYIKTVFQVMTETLVCNCWEEQKPGGFDSISDWIDAANSHHLEGTKITSKSTIDGLAQMQLLLEITNNTEGYLWKLIITN